MRCEICGSETNEGITIKMEGTELLVCPNCEDLGSPVSKSKGDEEEKISGKQESTNSRNEVTRNVSRDTKKRSSKVDEPFEELATDYGGRVRDRRESKKMTQEELAKELGVKESRIKKIEREEMTPNESLRKKLENFLNISLTEEIKSEEWESGGGSGDYTIGDIIEKK